MSGSVMLGMAFMPVATQAIPGWLGWALGFLGCIGIGILGASEGR